MFGLGESEGKWGKAWWFWSGVKEREIEGVRILVAGWSNKGTRNPSFQWNLFAGEVYFW